MAKKILAWMLVIAMTATIAIGGTLAYLTDRDSEANVFTVGDVKIDLEEDFEQDSTLIPGVDIEKKPTITNTGINDAWVWLEFAIPSALDNWALDTQVGSNQNVIHWNQLGATTDGYVTETRVANAIAAGHLPEGTTVDSITSTNSTWNLGGKTEFSRQAEINGVDYNIYVIGYNKALEPGEETLPNIYKVFLDSRVDIDPEGNWNFVEGGNVTELNWNSEEDGNPVIYVSAYAMQTEGFANVDEAIRAYQKQWGDNGSEYADPNAAPPVEVPEDAGSVQTFEDLKAAMSNGGDYVIEAPITVEENLTVAADTAIYCTDANNVLSFENNSKVTVNADAALALYGVQMDGNGTYSFDEDGSIVYDADARRTTPLLNAGAGSTLTLGTQTKIENVVAKGAAVVSVKGTDDNRAKVVLEHATITNCAGESGAIINVDHAGDVVIGEGTVISNNASYNNNNHGIIRVYNAWDAANPSTVTMNGGEISNNYYSGNGMIGLYYGKMIMNGGKLVNNSWFEDNQKHNGFYPVVYVHSNSSFEMNDGEISGNSVRFGVLNCLNSAVEPAITINGGTVTNNTNTDNNTDAFAAVVIEDEGKVYKSLSVSENANVTGTVWDYYTDYYTIEEYFAKIG